MTTSNQDSQRETRIVEMVFPNQTNHYGTLFGGDALRLMDMAAFVTASRHARRPVVTASSERIDFHVPVRQGQLAEVVGRVTSTGRTSLTVEVELWTEDLLTGSGNSVPKAVLFWWHMTKAGPSRFLNGSKFPPC